MNVWLKQNRTTGLLVLGCGVMGSYFALKTTRSSHCLSPTASVFPNYENSIATKHSESLQLTKQLSFLQKVQFFFRFIYLWLIFSPILFIHTAAFLTRSTFLENLEVRYLIFVLHTAGPAFIKLGQWAGTRRDLFSENFCRILSSIHTRCNLHSWDETKKLLIESFGESWDERLVIQDPNPIGSGCVAQVYQGYLIPPSNEAKSGSSQERVPIAVKVLHPGIVEAMDMDIRLMKSVASAMDYLYPDLHWVALKDCVNEFALNMQDQVPGLFVLSVHIIVIETLAYVCSYAQSIIYYNYTYKTVLLIVYYNYICKTVLLIVYYNYICKTVLLIVYYSLIWRLRPEICPSSTPL